MRVLHHRPADDQRCRRRTRRCATIVDRNLDNPIVMADRHISGVQYNLTPADMLNIDLSSGSDVVNLRGTSAVTNVFGHDGNERWYVSSRANEDFLSGFGPNPTQFLEGNLDFIRGYLNIDAGAGRHILMISDEASVVGDPNIVITDPLDPLHPLHAGHLLGTEIEISGMAPAPIGYQAAMPNGNFFDGITMWTGFGDDTVAISGTHNRNADDGHGNPMMTVTTLNTGLGNDHVDVSLMAGQDGFFVVNTQRAVRPLDAPDADCGVDGSPSSAGRVRRSPLGRTPCRSRPPMIIIGGQGNDDCWRGDGLRSQTAAASSSSTT